MVLGCILLRGICACKFHGAAYAVVYSALGNGPIHSTVLCVRS